MECEFVTARDKRFLEDNILDKEILNPAMETDLTAGLIDFESLYSVNDDELIPSLPNGLHFGIFDEIDMSSLDTVPADFWKELSDSSSSDSGIESVSIKNEPLSPASSSCSESIDSGHFPLISADTSACPVERKRARLSPSPLSPSPLSPSPTPLHQDAWLASVTIAADDDIIVATALKCEAPDTPPQSPPQSPLRPADVKPVPALLNPPRPAAVDVSGPAVSIQPRPEPSTTPHSKPLILTPEEFAQLTAQGVLKFHCPTDGTDVLAGAVSAAAVTPAPTRVCTAIVAPPRLAGGMDVKVVKRQQRMIKNRESACLSRKRKKEYLSGLEQQLQDSAFENSTLREENDQLRSRLDTLQTENESLKRSNGLKKTAKVVLAVIFMFTLNLGPLSQLGARGPAPAVGPGGALSVPGRHLSRTLLSYDGGRRADSGGGGGAVSLHNATDSVRRSIDVLRRSLEAGSLGAATGRDLALRRGDAPGQVCPTTYINMTESQRLLNELTGWVQGHKEEWTRQLYRPGTGAGSERRQARRAAYRAPRRPRSAISSEKLLSHMHRPSPHLHGHQEEEYGVQVFTGAADNSYQKFLKVIHQRNDTFYVVSFRQDHYLLPATASNKTRRPRMSLVMPAVGLNETMQPPAGSIAMMQIDCEVVGTRLVYVHSSAVPAHLRPNLTSHVSPPPPTARPQRRRSKRPRPAPHNDPL